MNSIDAVTYKLSKLSKYILDLLVDAPQLPNIDTEVIYISSALYKQKQSIIQNKIQTNKLKTD